MITIIWIILAAGLLSPLAFFLWMHTAKLQAGGADALIVLGYRCDRDEIHPLLKERLDSVLYLLSRYEFKRVIVSGGAVTSSLTEAEIMKRYLIEHGVPPERILPEDRSRNTVHNVINCSILMQQNEWNSCLLVSNSFHIRRMQFIMKQLDFPAKYYANRSLSNIMKQWTITFQEIRAYRLTLPWLDKVKEHDAPQMMG